jgi:alpha-D-xyloside xylohydrolase
MGWSSFLSGTISSFANIKLKDYSMVNDNEIMKRLSKALIVNKLKKFTITVLILCISCLVGYTQSNLQWKKVAPGIWSGIVGQPDKVNFFSVAGLKPRTEAIEAMGNIPFPLDSSLIKAEIRDGKTYLRFPLNRNEKIFGFGLNFKRTEIRGRNYRLHVDHYGTSDNGSTQAPVPFYLSSDGYGVLINSARYIDVWMSTAVLRDSKDHRPANVDILVPVAGAEIFIFGGPSMLDAVRRYNLYQGGGCIPPKWGLGFWHRTPSNFTAEQVRNEVAVFEKRGVPLSVIGLEPGWQSKSYPCTYEWNPVSFPNPASFLNDMTKAGIKVNLWMHPWVSTDAEIFNSLEPYSGSHTVFGGLAPDYTMPEVTNIISTYFGKNHLDIGVSGYKMDENDGNKDEGWYFPDVAKFPSGTLGEQMHQFYGTIMQKMTTEMFHKRNLRTYGLVRSSNAGATSFPFVLYNDYYDHKDFITALINSSFVGMLWTPEVRNSESRTAEEWLRRFQTVCFSPLAILNAWEAGTTPWSFTEVEKQVTDVIKLRMQLIPYFYTAFADYAFYGIPPVRSMNFLNEFSPYEKITRPADDLYNTAVKKEMKDQFMVGDYLMVAPMFTGETERKVILPIGKWYDFYTGEYAGDGEVISIKPGLDKIPVFVKDGGIIPMIPPVKNIGQEKLPLEIRYYGQKDGSYSLYDDDGTTYDYENGKFTRIELKVTKDKKGKYQTIVNIPKGASVWSYNDYKWKFMTLKETDKNKNN